MRRQFVSKFILTLLVVLVSVPGFIFFTTRSQIFSDLKDIPSAPVAIVFGAGLASPTTPSDVLSDRLRVASELFHAGKVQTILVSGDNRFANYNEPAVMESTLVETFAVPQDSVYVDYAGRRTYDTCIRAKEIWKIDEAILVTQAYHLPRAIWTCERLGVKSTGVSASLQPYVSNLAFKFREVMAIYKSFIDVYLIHPDYIHGEFIKDL